MSPPELVESAEFHGAFGTPMAVRIEGFEVPGADDRDPPLRQPEVSEPGLGPKGPGRAEILAIERGP